MSLIHGLSSSHLRGDVAGGLVAAVVALPLALAFATVAGLAAPVLFVAFRAAALPSLGAIPLAALGTYGANVRICAFMNNGGHGMVYHGNHCSQRLSTRPAATSARGKAA